MAFMKVSGCTGEPVRQLVGHSFLGYAVVFIPDVTYEWSTHVAAFTDQRERDESHVDSLCAAFMRAPSRTVEENAIRVSISAKILDDFAKEHGIQSPMPRIPQDWATLPAYNGIVAKQPFVVEAGQHRLLACEKWVDSLNLAEDKRASESWWVAEVYDADTLAPYDLAVIRMNPETVALPDTPGRQYLQQSKLLASAPSTEDKNKILANLIGFSPDEARKSDSSVPRQIERVRRLMDSKLHQPLVDLLEFPAYCDTFKPSQFDKVMVSSQAAASFNRWPWYAQTKLEEQANFWKHTLQIKPQTSDGDDSTTRRTTLRLRNTVTSTLLKGLSRVPTPRTTEAITLAMGALKHPKSKSDGTTSREHRSSLMGALESSEYDEFIKRAAAGGHRNTQIIQSLVEFGSWTSKEMKCANQLSFHMISWISPQHLSSYKGKAEVFTLEGSLQLFLNRSGGDKGSRGIGLSFKIPNTTLNDFFIAFRRLVESYFKMFQTRKEYYRQTTLDEGSWNVYLERFNESIAWLKLAQLVRDWFKVRGGGNGSVETGPFGHRAMKEWVHTHRGEIKRNCLLGSLESLWIKPISDNPAFSSKKVRQELENEVRNTIVQWQLRNTTKYVASNNTDKGDFPTLQEKNEWLTETIGIYQEEIERLKIDRAQIGGLAGSINATTDAPAKPSRKRTRSVMEPQEVPTDRSDPVINHPSRRGPAVGATLTVKPAENVALALPDERYEAIKKPETNSNIKQKQNAVQRRKGMSCSKIFLPMTRVLIICCR
jgi:hypothetical protein